MVDVISPVHALEDPGFQTVGFFSEGFEPQSEVETRNGHLGNRQKIGTTETQFKPFKYDLDRHIANIKTPRIQAQFRRENSIKTQFKRGGFENTTEIN